MAWLIKTKRLNKETGRQELYYRIGYRDEKDQTKSRALGFVTSAQAKSALKVFEGKQAAGEPIEPKPTAPGSSATAPSKPKMPTLNEYFKDTYLPIVKRDKAERTYIVARTSSHAFQGTIGNTPLDEITYTLVDAHITTRKEQGRRSRTLIIELRDLKAALQHAADRGVITVVPKLPKIQDRDHRPHRFLTEEEARALLKASRPFDEQPHEVTRGKPPINRDPLTYLVVLMALNTGMRKQEMLTRGWEDIRWKDGLYGSILVGAKPQVKFQVKTRRERVIPLTPELRQELERVWTEAGSPRSGWIFPSPSDPKKPRANFKHGLNRACKRAGLPEIHPHGLRHTWATRLAMAGVDRRTLMELGGWKEGRMLDEIYAHTTDEHKVNVMARMGIAPENSNKE